MLKFVILFSFHSNQGCKLKGWSVHVHYMKHFCTDWLWEDLTLSGMREELPCTWFLKKCSNYCFAPCAAPEKMKTCQWFHSPLARFAKCTRNVITQLKVIYISSVSPSWEWNNFVRYKSALHNVASMYRDLHRIIDYLRKFEILIVVSVRKRTGHDSSLPIAH